MAFDLNNLGFDFNINEDSGEMDIVTKPTTNEQQHQATTQQQQQPDRFVELDNRFVSIEQQIANQNKTLGLIAQYLGANNQVQDERRSEDTDDEVLGELFQDVDKGKAFINNLVAKVTATVTKQFEDKINPMMQSITPIVAQNSVVAEMQQFAATHPDLQEYLPAMKYLYDKLPDADLNISKLYNAAKSMGLRSVNPTQQRQNANVTNINRNLPDRLESGNAQLNNKKSADTTREAFDQALEELGMTG